MGVLLWQRNNWRLLLFLIFYSLGVPLLETGAKLAVARPRPYHYFVSGPPLHPSHGFPSGHALAAAAFYGLLLVLLRRRVRSRGWQRVITGGILLLILLIGCSRIYIGAHWPSDVLGGFALGGAYCLLAVAVYERIERRADARTDRTRAQFP
jgi:membrane-associated phospholipid phosphatase